MICDLGETRRNRYGGMEEQWWGMKPKKNQRNVYECENRPNKQYNTLHLLHPSSIHPFSNSTSTSTPTPTTPLPLMKVFLPSNTMNVSNATSRYALSH